MGKKRADRMAGPRGSRHKRNAKKKTCNEFAQDGGGREFQRIRAISPKRNTTKKFRGKGRRRVRVPPIPLTPTPTPATCERRIFLCVDGAQRPSAPEGDAAWVEVERQVQETAANKVLLHRTLGILDGIAKCEERGPSTAGLVSLLAPQENDLSFRDEAILLEHDPETREGWTDNFDCEPPSDGLFIQGPNDPR